MLKLRKNDDVINDAVIKDLTGHPKGEHQYKKPYYKYRAPFVATAVLFSIALIAFLSEKFDGNRSEDIQSVKNINSAVQGKQIDASQFGRKSVTNENHVNGSLQPSENTTNRKPRTSLYVASTYINELTPRFIKSADHSCAFSEIKTVGEVISTKYEEGDIKLASLVVENNQKGRSLINIEPDYESMPLAQVHQIVGDLPLLLTKGNTVEVSTWVCGAAGRFEYIESVKLVKKTSPAEQGKAS